VKETLNVQGTFSQGAAATLDMIFSNGWGKVAATGQVTLAGSVGVTVEAGTPDAVWADIVTSNVGLTNNIANPPPAAYQLQTTATKLQIRKP